MQIHVFLNFAFVWILRTSARSLARNTTDWASVQCPSDTSTVLPTPTYGYTDSVFTVCTEYLINAPAELIYNTLIDFKSYHLWNTFVVDVQLPSNITNTPEDVYIGMQMTFITTGLIPLINTTSGETVTVLDNDADAGYLLPAWGLLPITEHANILVSQGGGVTRYVSYETYYQELLAAPILLLRSALKRQFDQQGEDLRAYVESLV